MHKYYILGLLFIGMAIQAGAQTVRVVDTETRKPLEFVTISLNTTGPSAITDTLGQADVSSFEGAQDIIFRRLGYGTRILSYDELSEQSFVVGLPAEGFDLEQVVVSATRWAQSRDRVAARVRTIRPEEIALQNPQTAADLLGMSGEVFVQKSQQGGGSPMIRGFATNRLLYSVDGVRMNTAIFRSGNIQNVINLDPFIMENAEVLFGPGSVIYGSDAIGGVMSFQTLTPRLGEADQPRITGKAVARYSSANREQTGHLDVNVGWEKWALVTSISSWRYDHLRQGRNGPEAYLKPFYVQRQTGSDEIINQEDDLLQRPSAYDQMNLMQKVRFRPNDRWDFEYGFHYSETSPYGRYDRHNRTRGGQARYAEWNYGPQSWMMNNLSISHRADMPLYDHVKIRLAQQSFEESRIDRDLNDPDRRVRTEQVEAYSANLDFVKHTHSRNTLYYGVEYVRNEIQSSGFIEHIVDRRIRSTSTRYPQSDWNSLAVYLSDEYRLSDQWTVQAGVRYNQFSLGADFSRNQDFFPLPFERTDLNNSAFTGSLGAVYRPSDVWVIRGSFGTAFRSPNVDDVGKIFDSEPGSVVLPNAELDAEYAYNLDLGIARKFGDVFKIDVTAYYTQLDNALVRRDFTLNGQDSIVYDGVLSQVQAIQNAARANVYGVQAGIEWRLPKGFTFNTDVNVQVGEEELDDGSVSPSRHAAPFFGVSRLTYARGPLNLQINVMYQGERTFEELSVSERRKDEIYAKDEDGNNYAPAWYTLNLKASYEINEQFLLSGGMENITDQRYRPYSSGISGPGRNFILSATVRW